MWFRYSPNYSKTRQTLYALSSRQQWCQRIPADALRATVISNGDTLQVDSIGQTSISPTHLAPSITIEWHKWNDQCSQDYGWVPEEMVKLGNEWEIFGALMDNRLIIVLDGSYSSQVGTAAVQLISQEHK